MRWGMNCLSGHRRGHILTARGTKLLQEIDQVIPRLEALWSGETFSPRLTTDKVRVVMTDMAAALMLPCITRALPQQAPGLRIEVVPWTEHAYDQLASGAVDLVFSPIAAPPPLRVQLLYNEEFVCVLANTHPYKGKTLTIKKYLELKHVVIETQPGQQTLVDRSLTEGGYRRNIWLKLPYFIPAIAALQDTDYVLTCPSRLAKQMLSRYALHAIKAPPEIPAFSYFMFWHPRLTDENLHSWFREFVLDSCAREFGDSKR
jgi:DNA-binding transcriptional LysR family regulator